jgi:hypothetical protein
VFEDVKIKGEVVDRVEEYKYLGTIIDKLSWQSNINRICDKSRKRLYHLRKLKEFTVETSVMRTFYDSTTVSVLAFGAVVWYNNLTVALKEKLKSIEKTANKIIRDTKGCYLEEVYERRSISLAKRIMKNANHPLKQHFNLLQSGKRLKSLKTRTNRYKNSFVPTPVETIIILKMRIENWC